MGGPYPVFMSREVIPSQKRPAWANSDPLLAHYFDTEWGREVRDERGLFERLALEGFQAGLTWLLILKRRETLNAEFANFDPDTVARFTEDDVERIASNPDMIRNKRKIRAVITNAQATIALRERGGLAELIWSFAPETQPRYTHADDAPTQSTESAALAKELKRHGFTFVGPVSMYALMEAIGMVTYGTQSV